MDIMAMTRELGKAIQQDDRYTAYTLAKAANDNDTELQELIGSFNIKRMDINKEMSSENKDEERLAKLDGELKEVYGQIMSNKNMMIFNAAQGAMEEMMNEITQIINLCANGENPDTCQAEHSCSGSCSSCGGCH